jgi:HAD superfamily hydrolase (TIGR01509 family)
MRLDLPNRDFAGYIFDLDGTLIDSMPLHYRAWDAAMREAGLVGALSEDLFYSLGGVPTREVAEQIAAHYGLAIDPDAVMHRKESFYLGSIVEITVIEPVAAIAREANARGRPLAIATGGTPDIALPALDASGLRSLFPVIVTPLDVPPGRGKPAPDMFLLAAQRLGIPPAECVVFEDADPGIAAARAAGMTVVRVPSRDVARAESTRRPAAA